ncbi:MAG TPA: SDR family oxidoreductase [Burkholderiales bacterium]|nr:SDR family oxidoreductase [Burkholderiales bacterium]
MVTKVAVVTGGNRGIGYEICRELGQRGIHVVLTSRDAAKGKAACKSLSDAGLPITYCKLDVTSARSVKTLAAFVVKQFGRIDILINNAGIMIDPHGARLVDLELKILRATLETNTLAPLMLIQALLPLMKKRKYGRIVNMSSTLGQLCEMSSGTPAYRVSKTALNALTRIVAAEARAFGILVNSMSPGWVKTDMGGPHAPRTVAQGADTAVWLATLPAGGPTGGFFYERKPIPW